MIGKEKLEALVVRMQKLGIVEDNLTEKFILGSGKGGQKVNKTASCVYLKDPISGIETKCQKTRSRTMNRYYARHEICDRLEARIYGEQSKKKQEEAKVRKQKKRRSRKLQEKLVDDKRKHGEKKTMRGKPQQD
jgi:peptide chain release factor